MKKIVAASIVTVILAWSFSASAEPCKISVGQAHGDARSTNDLTVEVEAINGTAVVEIEVECDEKGLIQATSFASADGRSVPASVGYWGMIEGAKRGSYTISGTLSEGTWTTNIGHQGQWLVDGRLDGVSHRFAKPVQVTVVPKGPPPPAPVVPPLGPPETDQPDQVEQDSGEVAPPILYVKGGGTLRPNDDVQRAMGWGAALQVGVQPFNWFEFGGRGDVSVSEAKVNTELTLDNLTATEYITALTAYAELLLRSPSADWIEGRLGFMAGWIHLDREQGFVQNYQTASTGPFPDHYVYDGFTISPKASLALYPTSVLGFYAEFTMPTLFDVQRVPGNHGKTETYVLPTGGMGLVLRFPWETDDKKSQQAGRSESLRF